VERRAAEDQNPKGLAYVESHPFAKNAKGWGTQLPSGLR